MRAILLAFTILAGLCAQETTVILVRHAEKATREADTPISEQGARRAAALVPQLTAFAPTVLFVSDRLRTRQTMAPTATHLGLIPQVHPSGDPAGLARVILERHRGATVAVAWHHGPHEAFVRALGVQGPLPTWTDSTFDRIWVVRIPAQGPVRFEERVQSPVPVDGK